MAARNLDVVILGGGNAGMGATVATREAELTVAMIEPDLLGGTCPNSMRIQSTLMWYRNAARASRLVGTA
jgi:pyruvate/2-oxoglutarate dehydrogenase complex dihydrolipoamide dehydrogenase (E3) component